MTESPGNTNQQSVDSPQSGSFENIQSDSSFIELNPTSPQPSPTLSSNSSYTIQNGNQVEEQNNMVVESSQNGGGSGAADATFDEDMNAEDGSGSKKAAALAGNNKNTTNITATGDSTANGVGADNSANGTPPNEYANLTDQQRKEKNALIKKTIQVTNLKLNEKWYLINKIWYDKWDSNSYSPEELGPIMNESLLIQGTEHLRLNAIEDQDFIVVPESCWDYFKSYGCPTPIVRKVAKNLISLQIDYKYPQCLKFFKSSQPNKIIDHYVCKSETISSVKERVCKIFEINPVDVRVWDYYNHTKYAELKNAEYVSNSKLVENQLILLDERLEDGSWPPEKTHSYGGYSSSRYNSRSGSARPGVTGLDNLGNTCFMNSSLQCLSNTVPLTRYLLNDKHHQDLNRDNPLGCHGDLAIEYAKLIKQIWRGDLTSTGPRDLKSQIERFAPQFQGYHQHDSQELLAFLLDGLHEDLNKVKKKPFIEGKDYDGRPDTIIAKEHWDMHKARNDSIIVDWFQSQLKSRLVCPVCSKVSITFDPFMYLSLPLPVNIRKQFEIVFVPYDSSVSPSQHKVEMPKTGVFEEMLDIISKKVGVETERLVATMQSMSVIQKVYKPTQCVDIVGNRDTIVIYEVLDLNPAKCLNFKVTMKTSSFSNHFPFVLSVPAPDLNCVEDLYFAIIERLKHLIKDYDKVKEIFENNQKPVPHEDEQDDESMSNRHGYNNYQSTYFSHTHNPVMRKKQKDPRFIFQMAPDFKSYEKKDFEFDPVNFDSVVLQWDEESFEHFFDAEKLQHCVPNYVIHRDISSEKTLTLDQCLELFTTVEQLGPEDPWYCSNCKEHQRATKKFDIWSAPPILVIHLKRFSYKKQWREKLDTLVNFPLEGLDLSPYVLNKEQADPIYDLFAVSNHYGSLGGGHYTAYALNDLEKQWIKFDDSSTHNVDPQQVITEAAYVLFYRRRDTREPNFQLNDGIKEFKDTVNDLVATNPPQQTNGNSGNNYESNSWNYSSRSSSSMSGAGGIGTSGARLGHSNRENGFSYSSYPTVSTRAEAAGQTQSTFGSASTANTQDDNTGNNNNNTNTNNNNNENTNGSATADDQTNTESNGEGSSLMEVE